MKYAAIHLPYYKQGDDLGHHLAECATVEEALDAHAQQLQSAAELLVKIRKVIAGQNVTFDADTHMIQASGPDAIIDALIDAGFASPPWEEDEDESDAIEEEKTGWDAIF
jgi:hypothetical protein